MDCAFCGELANYLIGKIHCCVKAINRCPKKRSENSDRQKKRFESQETKDFYTKVLRENSLSKEELRKRSLDQWKNPDYRKKVTEYLVDLDWETLKWTAKRSRVIREQEGKCIRCENDSWLGNPIQLEIDHIDGNRKNNSRENLEGLCPNCHSQTRTWRGRGYKWMTSPGDEKSLVKPSEVEERLSLGWVLGRVGWKSFQPKKKTLP